MNENSLKLEFERRWAMPAGILAVLGVALIGAALVYAGSNVSNGDTYADFLRSVDEHRSAVIIGNVLRGIGYVLLAAPLVFLFKAAAARTPQVRTGLIGLIVAAPLFIGLGAIATSVTTLSAATDFRDNGAAKVTTCVADKTKDQADSKDKDSAEQIQEDCEDDVATDAQRDTATNGLTIGLGLAGALGFTVAVVYTSLWCMRTGLITRFWGSLGLALGAVSLLFPQFVLIWMIYVGLLIAGWIPGGRPPAWAAGEAIPWPMPGEQLARDMEDENGDVIDGSAEEVDPHEGTTAPEPGEAPQIERRKRKKRSDS